jgi:uncharacterized membrane protein YhiD involved in acid resistance
MLAHQIDGVRARLRTWALACVVIIGPTLVAGPAWAQVPPPPQPAAALTQPAPSEADADNLMVALIRLPVAAALGAALALRPRRRGTPARSTAVVQTQILLSVVGAVIMLVVGASLARAFGIVGAANLIRYRSKIEDPKDAVVMLCTLAVGLASGVGLYRLAVFSTAFLVAALWVIESFEPESMKHFSLSVKKGEQTDELRRQVEAVLRRHHLEWELRTLGDEEIGYYVKVPVEMKMDAVSEAIAKLDPDGHIAIEWDEKKKKTQ